MSRADFFCEDYREFGDALSHIAREAESLALLTPSDALFNDYRQRIFAVARELSAIDGGLQTVVAITLSHQKPC